MTEQTTPSPASKDIFDEMDAHLNTAPSRPTPSTSSTHEKLTSTPPSGNQAGAPTAHPGASPMDTTSSIPSLTLSQVGRTRRPNPSTLCETCPAALWTASEIDLQCYCRIMRFTSWSQMAPYPRIACDGLQIAMESLQRNE